VYPRREVTSEVSFRDLLEAAPDAMIIANRQGMIALVNSETERLFGYRREELLGHPIELLLPAALRVAHANHRKTYFNDPHRRPMGSGLELSGRRKDGTEFPVEVSLSPVPTEDGMVVTAAVRDLTERLRMEEIRREVSEHRAAEEALAHFASHDLQEPLRMVSSYAQLLGNRYRGRLDPDADEFIDHIVDGVARMRRLIGDLVAYSQVGTSSEPFQSIDCEAVLSRVLSDLKLAIVQAGAMVTHDSLPAVLGDGVQLGQLFQNLVQNAIKFRGPRFLRVHIRAERSGNEWTFSVSDNGIGIAPEHWERIFQIFQRLHSAAGYPGTGIGLAIAKRIIERHNGRIWVASHVGEGTTFHFTLPSAPRGRRERRRQ
jgi:PAS domain S-box-containing protein